MGNRLYPTLEGGVVGGLPNGLPNLPFGQSKSLRAELLLELSGLSRDQKLMIKACAGGVHEFDKYAQIMTEHHGLIHLQGNKLLDSAPLRAPGSDSKYGGRSSGSTSSAYLGDMVDSAYVAQEHRADDH